jgi:hypothetical protein
MTKGILWRRESDALQTDIDRAAARLKTKTGQEAVVCLVRVGEADEAEGVEVREAKNIQPNHILVGVDE